MHDPLTVAFEIKYPWKKYGKNETHKFLRNQRSSFITIWHKDPCEDGSDDSCGWFKRARHCDKEILNRIENRYNFGWDPEHSGLFDKEGYPRFSTMGVVLNLIQLAVFEHFKGSRKKADKFLNENMFEILFFAENPIDSLHPFVTQKYGKGNRESRIREAANIIYPWILRKEQKWYQHARWHMHHWRFQVHPWCNLKRRFWDKCCKCGKRGFKGSAMGDWSGKRLWHSECEENKPIKQKESDNAE